VSLVNVAVGFLDVLFDDSSPFVRASVQGGSEKDSALCCRRFYLVAAVVIGATEGFKIAVAALLLLGLAWIVRAWRTR
jgi:hypothetical protein